MQPIRRILVAVKDPTAKSLPAVAKAVQVARALHASIELFHAIDTLVYVDTLGLLKEGLKEIERTAREKHLAQLDRIAARIRVRGLEVTTAVEWDYPIHESLIRRARKIGAHLLVAERHGGRHVTPWLLRVTDWELLRLSPIPVLIVKSPRPYRRPAVLAAVDPTHAFAKPARLDEDILSVGDTVARALHGKLHCVHAYTPIPADLPSDIRSTANATAAIEAKAAGRARVGMERLLKKVSIPRSQRHLVDSHPINAIPDVARKTRSAIVVMGAISRSGIKNLLIGNTAERVLDDLECDLLVLKPRHYASRVPRAKRGMRLAAVGPMY